MGTWGPGVYSNDTAADLKEEFRDLLANGIDPDQATAQLMVDFSVGADRDVDHDFWLALAVTAHRLGYLRPVILANAIEVIDDPSELERWPESLRTRRRAALAKVRKLLSEAQPEPKRIRARAKVDTALEPGQHVLWELGHGKPDAVMRILGVRQDRGADTPSCSR